MERAQPEEIIERQGKLHSLKSELKFFLFILSVILGPLWTLRFISLLAITLIAMFIYSILCFGALVRFFPNDMKFTIRAIAAYAMILFSMTNQLDFLFRAAAGLYRVTLFVLVYILMLGPEFIRVNGERDED